MYFEERGVQEMPKSDFKASKKMGAVLERERKALHMSQRELANKIFYNEDSLQKVETGKQGLSNAIAACLMHLFGCDAEYLRGDSEYKTQEERENAQVIKAFRQGQESRNAHYDEIKAFNEYAQVFIKKYLKWEFVAIAGISKERNGHATEPPARMILSAEGINPPLPDGKDFIPQFNVYKDTSGGLHVLNIAQLEAMQKMIHGFMETGLKEIETNTPCPTGWEDCSDGRRIRKQYIDDYFMQKEGGQDEH